MLLLFYGLLLLEFPIPTGFLPAWCAPLADTAGAVLLLAGLLVMLRRAPAFGIGLPFAALCAVCCAAQLPAGAEIAFWLSLLATGFELGALLFAARGVKQLEKSAGTWLDASGMQRGWLWLTVTQLLYALVRILGRAGTVLWWLQVVLALLVVLCTVQLLRNMRRAARRMR